MQTNLASPRIYTFVLLLCCTLFAQQHPTAPASQSNVAAQQRPDRNATPRAQEATKPVADHPAKPVAAGSKAPQSPREKAWQLLENACAGDKVNNRAFAIRVLGLIPSNAKSARLAEKTLTDDKPEVRLAAVAALGEMNSRASIPKLKKAIDDPDPSVALAAGHSLYLMHDNSAYEVYYEVLNGERKAKKGLLASQSSILHDPKRMATLSFQEGMSFVPFGGIGWGAIKAITKDDTSPIRAAAAKVLARDPDPATTKALTDAVGDKSWLVQVAALEALALRGDPSVLHLVEPYMSDEKPAVQYTAAATVIRLTASKNSRRRKQEKSSGDPN